MKKALALFLLMVLTSSAAYAVTANPVTTLTNGNQIEVDYEGQSNFGAVGAFGSTATGNPGYVVLKGCDAANICYPYYLWVASDGKLYKSSYLTVSAYASFPTGNWNRSNMPVGTLVGGES